MTYSFKLISAALTLAVLAACSSTAPEPAAKPAASTPPPASPSPSPSAARLRVADLMAKAGCAGEVIGTQLYSYETGRCMLAGAEVTIAVFDTAALRDQWVQFGGQFGGTLVVGEGWAAGVDKPDAAKTLANALGGKLV